MNLKYNNLKKLNTDLFDHKHSYKKYFCNVLRARYFPFNFIRGEYSEKSYRYTLGNIPALGSPKTEIAYARQCLRKKYPVVSCYALMNSC